MAGFHDPTPRSVNATRVPATSAPGLCGWCFGAGKYLVAMDCDVPYVYLPVVCCSCDGTGRSAPTL